MQLLNLLFSHAVVTGGILLILIIDKMSANINETKSELGKLREELVLISQTVLSCITLHVEIIIGRYSNGPS